MKATTAACVLLVLTSLLCAQAARELQSGELPPLTALRDSAHRTRECLAQYLQADRMFGDQCLLRHTLLDDNLFIAGEAGGRHLLCDSSAAAAAAASGDAAAAAAAASSEYDLPSAFCTSLNACTHGTLLLNHSQTALACSISSRMLPSACPLMDESCSVP